MNRSLSLCALVCLALLAACEKKATGQVAAVVNGEEITLQEINTELEALSPSQQDAKDKKKLQQAALQRIVERRLLAQAARDDGLDERPEFLIRRRQLEDALLVQLLGKNTTRATELPDEKEVTDFIEKNPSIFSDRKIYKLDRIQFPKPTDPEQLKLFEVDHSMAEVVARLQGLGIQFIREAAGMDSAKLGQPQLEQIRNLPAGEPFMFPEGDMITVAVITDETSQPIDPDQRRPIAVQAIRNKAVIEAMQQRLKTAKDAAEIEYQPGFAPAKPEAGDKSKAPPAE